MGAVVSVVAALLGAGLGFAILSQARWLGVERPIPKWVQLSGAGLACAAGAWFYATGGPAAALAAFAALMGALADAVDRVIPHRWVGLLAAVGLVRMATGALPWLPDLVLAAAMGAFFLVLYILLHGGIGLGDVKLAAAMGLGLGWPVGLDALIYGLLAGGLFGAGLLTFRRAKARDSMAFGPFLAFGVLLALLIHPG